MKKLLLVVLVLAACEKEPECPYALKSMSCYGPTDGGGRITSCKENLSCFTSIALCVHGAEVTGGYCENENGEIMKLDNSEEKNNAKR